MLLEERLRSLQEGKHEKHQIEPKNLVEGEKDPDKRRESLVLLFLRPVRPVFLAVREQRLHFANPRRRCSLAGIRKPALVVGEAAKALLFRSRKLEVCFSKLEVCFSKDRAACAHSAPTQLAGGEPVLVRRGKRTLLTVFEPVGPGWPLVSPSISTHYTMVVVVTNARRTVALREPAGMSSLALTETDGFAIKTSRARTSLSGNFCLDGIRGRWTLHA